jgi:hypothetical protein
MYREAVQNLPKPNQCQGVVVYATSTSRAAYVDWPSSLLILEAQRVESNCFDDGGDTEVRWSFTADLKRG